MIAPPLELRVDGETFTGFKSADVTQSMDAFASSYRIEYDDGPAENGRRAVIACGDPISLGIDGQILFDGYVDDARHTYAGDGKRARAVIGRSKLGDLLDVSAYGPKRWINASILDLANDLLEGYEVEVESRVSDGTEQYGRFAVNEGESIAALLLRAAKLRGLILLDEGGKLVITEAGEAESSTPIRYGDGGNILIGERQTSWRERFSEYRFRGQTRATDEVYGVDAAELEGVVEDFEVGSRRLRRLVINSWGEKSADLGIRAVNERNRRAGRSERLVYTLPGWLQDDGSLWRPNTRVNVFDPVLEVNATMLIVRVTTQLRPDVYRTEIELTRPEAFDVVVSLPVTGRGGAIR